MPDIAIAESIRRNSGGINITFASYATGADTFKAHGVHCINLGLPEQNPLLDTIVEASRLINLMRPSLVLAHEEFAVGPASAAANVKNAFITDWFGDENNKKMKALRFFDEILFIGSPGEFSVPSYITNEIVPIGPIIRPLTWSRGDRTLAREQLALKQGSFVIGVMPGGGSAESSTPIQELFLSALDIIDDQDIKVMWMAGRDAEMMKINLAPHPQISVLPYDPILERVMVAMDVVVTKANRVTLQELDVLGIPAISLSHRVGTIGDRLIAHMPYIRKLRGADLTANRLARLLIASKTYVHKRPPDPRIHLGSTSLDILASRILKRVR